MTGISFVVRGVPVPQGSKRVVGGRPAKNGQFIVPRLVDVKPKELKAWRADVVRECEARLPAAWEPFPGPVHVALRFALARPRSVAVSRRQFPTVEGSGDVDKLARAVLDAMTTAHVYGTDAQVVTLHVAKHYAGDPGCLARPGVHVYAAPATTTALFPDDDPEATEGIPTP